MITAYPLHWPAGYPRSTTTKASRFKATLGQAREFVRDEIRRLGAMDMIISSNIPLKQNGELRADWTKHKIADHGCAVYFTRNGNQVSLCCDSYNAIVDNLYAIGRTIEALRQIDRDGVSDFLNRAFTGFAALPAPGEAESKSCWDVLGIGITSDLNTIKDAYKKLAMQHHPDRNGDVEKFKEVNQAYRDATSFADSVNK